MKPLTVDISDDAKALKTAYWGEAPLPEGAELLGTVTRPDELPGILMRFASGEYVQGTGLIIRRLAKHDAQAAILIAEIRDRRLELGLTQAEAADRAGWSAQTWSAYETGTRRPGMANIARMADAVDLVIETRDAGRN